MIILFYFIMYIYMYLPRGRCIKNYTDFSIPYHFDCYIKINKCNAVCLGHSFYSFYTSWPFI